MSVNYGTGTQYPTVNLAVSKSRMKMYGSTTINPTYYLNKGQEFQIELFNPTTDVVLAKISLNGKLISNSGLVVKPGERVFLDRFLDENKKFLFDTYQVDNLEEVKQAIKDNGDLEVAFHKEKSNDITWTSLTAGTATINLEDYTNISYSGGFVTPTISNDLSFTTTTSTNTGNVFGNLDGMNMTTTGTDINTTYFNSVGAGSPAKKAPNKKHLLNMKSKKGTRRRIQKTSSKIETGRVEKGSTSSQKISVVDMEFETYAFHTVSYKMLPMSQKNLSSDEVVNKYCPNCGKKNKPTNKFCPSCGVKR